MGRWDDARAYSCLVCAPLPAGIVNEPPGKVSPTLKMVLGYARMLDPSDPLLTSRGLQQHPRAAEVWKQSIVPPVTKGRGGRPDGGGEGDEWDRAQVNRDGSNIEGAHG